MKVSYVFPWVNPVDPVWQDEYAKHSGNKINPDDPRFRENPLLRYHFRSIAELAPWIDEVVVIVSSKSQILPWMNTSTIKFIEHKDFIPQKYLPCFNSNTIETFLANVPTNPYIIYSNDDFYFNSMTTINDFFTEDGTPKFYSVKKDQCKNPFQQTCLNNFNVIRGDFPNEYNLYEYERAPHCQTPMLRQTIREVYRKHRSTMESMVTKFRVVEDNLNQYIYSNYQVLSGDYVKCPKNAAYFDMTLENTTSAAKEIFEPSKKLLCLNDVETTDSLAIRVYTGLLAEKFPNKCKYEN